MHYIFFFHWETWLHTLLWLIRFYAFVDCGLVSRLLQIIIIIEASKVSPRFLIGYSSCVVSTHHTCCDIGPTQSNVEFLWFEIWTVPRSFLAEQSTLNTRQECRIIFKTIPVIGACRRGRIGAEILTLKQPDIMKHSEDVLLFNHRKWWNEMLESDYYSVVSFFLSESYFLVYELWVFSVLRPVLPSHQVSIYIQPTCNVCNIYVRVLLFSH